MDFSEALKMMKNGIKICRSDWDINKYLFINKDGLIEYHSEFISGSEPDIIDSRDVMATDWKVYENLIGRVVKLHYTNIFGIIIGHTENGYSILFSNGDTGWVKPYKCTITSWECPAVKKALEQLKSIEEMENK